MLIEQIETDLAAVGQGLFAAAGDKGAQQLVDRVEKMTGAAVNKTSADGLFSLDATRCLGACGLAPVCIIDGKVYGNALMGNSFTNELRKIILAERGAKA